MTLLTPGDPVQIMLGDSRATPEQVAAMRHDMGLDLAPQQRFVRFVARAVQGDLGRSFFHRRPVLDVIGERLPATVELSVAAMVVAVLTGLPLGVLAAVHRGSALDKLATSLSLVGSALPGFWLGIMLILLFAVALGWMPVAGRIDYAFEVKRITGL